MYCISVFFTCLITLSLRMKVYDIYFDRYFLNTLVFTVLYAHKLRPQTNTGVHVVASAHSERRENVISVLSVLYVINISHCSLSQISEPLLMFISYFTSHFSEY